VSEFILDFLLGVKADRYQNVGVVQVGVVESKFEEHMSELVPGSLHPLILALPPEQPGAQPDVLVAELVQDEVDLEGAFLLVDKVFAALLAIVQEH